MGDEASGPAGKGRQPSPTSAGPEAPQAEAPKLSPLHHRVPSIFPIGSAVNRHDAPILQKQTVKAEELNPHILLPPRAPLLSTGP